MPKRQHWGFENPLKTQVRMIGGERCKRGRSTGVDCTGSRKTADRMARRRRRASMDHPLMRRAAQGDVRQPADSDDHFSGGRFRHGTSILRRRPDKREAADSSRRA